MLGLKKIAITGSIASGKSTVSKVFENCGAYILDADQIVHNLLNHRKDLQKKVITLLGQEIVEDGALNRKKIADLVFKDPILLSELEKIIHPEVRKEIENHWIKISKEKKHLAFVVEIPLLFETEPQNEFDMIIVIQSSKELCQKRYMQKTQSTEKAFNLRLSRQLPIELKAKKADLVLLNEGSIEDLKTAAKQAFSKIIS